MRLGWTVLDHCRNVFPLPFILAVSRVSHTKQFITSLLLLKLIWAFLTKAMFLVFLC